MPANYTSRMTTLQSIYGVGSDILVRMCPVNEEQIHAAVVGRIVEGGAVAEQGLNPAGYGCVFPDISFPFLIQSDVKAIRSSGAKDWLCIWWKVEGRDLAVFGSIERHVRCRV